MKLVNRLALSVAFVTTAACAASADDKIVKDGGESARAGNLILVVSGGLDDRASYKAAFDVFGKLADRPS